MEDKWSNIRVLQSTKERLRKKLRPGDSFNSVVERLLDKAETNKK